MNTTGQLASASVRLTLRPNQRLPLLNDGTRHVFAVAAGILSLEAKLYNERRVLELLYPGDLFATVETPLLPETAIIAGTASELIRYRDDRRDGMAGDVPSTWQRALAQRNTRRTLHLASLSNTHAEGRLADLLVESALFMCPGGSVETFLLPFSREQLAAYLALNPDTVSRLFTRFRSRGLFSSRRGRITILNWPALCQASPLSQDLIELAGRRSRIGPANAPI